MTSSWGILKAEQGRGLTNCTHFVNATTHQALSSWSSPNRLTMAGPRVVGPAAGQQLLCHPKQEIVASRATSQEPVGRRARLPHRRLNSRSCGCAAGSANSRGHPPVGIGAQCLEHCLVGAAENAEQTAAGCAAAQSAGIDHTCHMGCHCLLCRNSRCAGQHNVAGQHTEGACLSSKLFGSLLPQQTFAAQVLEEHR